jgi:hypothetical protein
MKQVPSHLEAVYAIKNLIGWYTCGDVANFRWKYISNMSALRKGQLGCHTIDEG